MASCSGPVSGPFLLALRVSRGSVMGTAASRMNRVALPSTCVSKRYASSLMKKGAGGRSSFSGVVATVFGATGFVGRYIVNRLGRVGSQVVIPYRGDEHDYRHLRPMGDLGQILFMDYSLRDPASIMKAVKHSNVVINLVGRDYETRNFSFADVHIDGARAIAQASRLAGVERLIHFSALNASADSASKFLQSKAYGEEVVMDAFPSATIIRPSDTYGHEDRLLNYYASLRVFPFGLIPMWKGGEGVEKRPVYVGDIARGVANIIADPTTAGKVYEFVGPKAYPLPELVQYIYQVMYRNCSIYSPPSWLFRFAAFMLEQSPFIPFMTRDVLTRLHLSNVPTSGLPGLEDLGVTPTVLESNAIAILRRYRDFLDFDKSIDDMNQPPAPGHTAK